MERAVTKEKMGARDSWLTVPRLMIKKDAAKLVVCLTGFFIGRAIVFQFLNPLCVSFLAAFIGSGVYFYVSAVFIALGLLTKLSGTHLFKYLVCLTMISAVHFISRKRLWRLRAFAQCAIAGAAVLLSGLLLAYLEGSGLYYGLLAVLEGLLVFMLSYILKKAVGIMTAARRKSILTGEELVSVAFFVAGVVAGSADIYVGSVSLRYFCCAYVLLLVCYKGGCAMAAATGLLLGFMLYLSGYWDISMAVILGLSGMTAGLFRNQGKVGVMAGFGFFGGLFFFMLDRTLLGFELLYSLISAGLVFSLTPARFYFNFASILQPMTDNTDEYIDAVKDMASTRLKAFSSAFEKLAFTFSGLSQRRTSLDKKDVSRLIDDLAASACGECPKKDSCWEEGFYHTYQTVFGALDACEKKGRITEAELGTGFSCVSKESFVASANRLFELYKANLSWNNRIAESRELVSQQLQGVSRIIAALADEVDFSMKFQEELEDKLIMELNKNKIEVDSVIVLENKTGKYEVTINRKSGFTKSMAEKEVLPVLNGAVKRKMRLEDDIFTVRRGLYSARYIEEKKYRVTSGVARMAKGSKGESGDSYSFMELKNGSCLLVLSDGMGSGKRAREESAATVGLLEEFIESGFEKDIAVKIINSVLVLKSGEESFSTLDICSIDLYTGAAEFIKIGAAATYLLRDGRVQVVKSSSLPMGMLNDVDLEASSRKLGHNDVILMVTDGVTDAAETYDTEESWLIKSLEGCRYANPQDIADYVLEEAKTMAAGRLRDDMTVLAARVWEKNG